MAKYKTANSEPAEEPAQIQGAADAPETPNRAPDAASSDGIDGTPVTVTAPPGLNLRSGPHPLYDVLEVLPDGAALTKLALPLGASVQGWALVYTGQRTGWCVARFLRALED